MFNLRSKIPGSGSGNNALQLLAILCLVIFLIIFSGLTACQKVINIDLNSPSPQLVVEANLSDQPGPCYVKLSETVNFDGITQIPAVNGAIVEISDSSSGIKEILPELKDGIYMTSTLNGIPGHRYRLKIKTDGEEYDAVSGMPFPVGFLKLNITREIEYPSRFGGASGGSQTFRYRVNYEIQDPEKYVNYYRFIIYHKNRKISSRRVISDQFHNGKVIAGDFVLRDSIDFDPGDNVRIELQNIDKNTYNFFRTLRNGASGIGFLSASPANPISNISNNGLGYFSAFSSKEGYLTIPY
jgi:hypothetical protein